MTFYAFNYGKLGTRYTMWIKVAHDCFFSLFFSPSNQITKGERINKETGELTASGELFISELKAGKEESSCKSRQLPQELRDQLKKLGIHVCSSSKHTSNHVPSEQREELLDKVLPLYIQVIEKCTFFMPSSRDNHHEISY